MTRSEIERMSQRVVADVGGALASAMAFAGDRLGLFRALAAHGPTTSAGLADRVGLAERYVREWLDAMVAAEYVEWDRDAARYSLSPAQAAVLADEGGAAFLAGACQLAIASVLQLPRVLAAFRDGGGVRFDELGADVAEGIHRLHRPGFEHRLVPEWLPAVPASPRASAGGRASVVDQLCAGIAVLDVGCGLGRSSLVMARAFPRSRIVGLDPDPDSIERARALARAGESDGASGASNLRYVAGTLADLADRGDRYDLITAFDCVHDMADPAGELARMRRLLADGGQILWLEPDGSDDPVENRNLVGKMRANLSPLHCLTVSLAAGGAGLGTLIGERGARDLAARAGFSHVERLPIADPLHMFLLLRVE